MKIRLNKSGGLSGKRLTAETEAELTSEELNELLKVIAVPTPASDTRKKDALTYTIQADDRPAHAIDPALVPKKFHALFQELFDNLKHLD